MSKRDRSLLAAGVAVLLAALALAVWTQRDPGPEATRVSLTDAVTAIEGGDVTSATLDDEHRHITLELTGGREQVASYPVLYGGELAKLLLRADVEVSSGEVSDPSPWPEIFARMIPLVVIMGFLVWFMGKRGMGVSRFTGGRGGKVEVPATRFTDLGGCDEVVVELAEVAHFLHNPERFTRSGARIPRGFLLVGPPGTGKTLLARAVAGEAGVPFFALSGSDFVETFVGVGAARVRSVFDKARKEGRAIIFIDEIDAVGKARTAGPSRGGAEERENTLNQLLVEMDGFTRSSGVIVLAATNRADVLDPALLRPGRFDRHIIVPAPDRRGRTAILELHARDGRFGPGVDFVALGRRTPGFTGADLANLMNEAALTAARDDRDVISAADMEAAVAVTVMGRERKSAVVSDRERRITAWHEAGHAVAALVLDHADDPVQVSIVPRGQAGGVTWMSGNDDSFLTRRQAEARLAVLLAGRAAEERLLGDDVTQGAASDFVSATHIATRMVTEFGMSELGLAHRSPELLSLGTQADQVVAEVNRLLDRALVTARRTLDEYAALVEAVAAELLAEESTDLDAILRLRDTVAGTVAATTTL